MVQSILPSDVVRRGETLAYRAHLVLINNNHKHNHNKYFQRQVLFCKAQTPR